MIYEIPDGVQNFQKKNSSRWYFKEYYHWKFTRWIITNQKKDHHIFHFQTTCQKMKAIINLENKKDQKCFFGQY